VKRDKTEHLWVINVAALAKKTALIVTLIVSGWPMWPIKWGDADEEALDVWFD